MIKNQNSPIKSHYIPIKLFSPLSKNKTKLNNLAIIKLGLFPFDSQRKKIAASGNPRRQKMYHSIVQFLQNDQGPNYIT